MDPVATRSEITTNLPPIENTQEPSSTPAVKPYPGIAIDEVFPMTYVSEWKTVEEAKRTVSVPAENLVVTFQYFKPQTITRDGRTIFRFVTTPGYGYWSNGMGISNLLGGNSKQIYLNSVGPGAVCCTNYWINDVTSTIPRTIFRSEDFGRFRGAMEIFDAEKDGIYELAHFDSCMRYFRDDCGSCSPEPRVYFKYDPILRKYRPVKNVLQKLVRAQFSETEEWLAKTLKEFEETKNVGTESDLRRSVISHVADLIHVGEERKAWNLFNAYRGIVDEQDRREIKKRLANCKFYRVLHHGNY